ncbi:hypothetical protein [Paracraurococcus ruber]|uniref:hypothetical protein n=1 Tax=Paracraurococcus ruber TaxID=77675 RepID=UPI0013051D47|nr:hypothetical protein [Paracraurococcus ruber]
MSEDGRTGAPGAEDTAEDGFMLLEGWMFGALMFEAAAERIEQFPPANDDAAEG